MRTRLIHKTRNTVFFRILLPSKLATTPFLLPSIHDVSYVTIVLKVLDDNKLAEENYLPCKDPASRDSQLICNTRAQPQTPFQQGDLVKFSEQASLVLQA
jgi:hypothetical protein